MSNGTAVPGALSGFRVVELGGLGPAPFAGMILADFGADVIRIDRPGAAPPIPGKRPHLLNRGRRSVALDLKSPGGHDVLMRLVDSADVLTEGFRPGVAERLGVGPDVCLGRNPGLIYGRMTGWGQEGPLAQTAGHDLNYLALSGVLGALGAPDAPPPPPLNLVGDFGGGGMLLALGIVVALVERGRSGQGQVIDAAILDGVTLLATTIVDLLAGGLYREARAQNILDGGAPFYRAYRTSDDRFMSVGAVEPQFYAALLEGLGAAAADWPQYDRERWPEQHRRFEELFAQRTLDEWNDVFAALDTCVAPVLHFTEAMEHPQIRARETYVDAFGHRQPAPAPRLGRTPGKVAGPAPAPGQHTREILAELGLGEGEVETLLEGAAVQAA